MVQILESREQKLRVVRIVSLIAATILALACGTNYAYSAWGPQYAERLQLTATQSNLISTTGNLGMYFFGLPLGMFVDFKGPRIGALCGSIVLGAGYLGIWRAYVAGPGKTHLAGLCILMGMTGAGGCIAFLGAMKTAAINFPSHRGTATSFPLAAFGLSAFFFSAVAGLISNDTGEFLLVLTIGSFTLTFIPCFFMRTTPTTIAYTPLPTPAPGSQNFTNKGRSRSKTASSRGRTSIEPGEEHHSTYDLASGSSSRDCSPAPSLSEEQDEEHLATAKDEQRLPGKAAHESLYTDVRNIRMLKYSEFYELWIIIGMLTGIGLMTINNIGADAQALWKAWDFSDKKVTHDFIRSRQRLHVSIISVCSFCGRLLGGIGSDLIVKKLNGSRFWCLFASATVFTLAQSAAVAISNPKLLVLLSSSTGIGYGILFGVSPTLVAETFGVNGMSQNWGMMTLGPAIFGEIFNIVYGKIYDAHSMRRSPDDNTLECDEGKYCYQTAYLITLGAGIFSMLAILWCIAHRNFKEARLKRKELEAIEEEHNE